MFMLDGNYRKRLYHKFIPSYRFTPSIEEHRDKQLNIILDGI
jgi:hypothetical protein